MDTVPGAQVAPEAVQATVTDADTGSVHGTPQSDTASTHIGLVKQEGAAPVVNGVAPIQVEEGEGAKETTPVEATNLMDRPDG
ncbi:hypothetical protein KIPB_000209 [Kipferlia bialata]|uniref:Uncharacterized protein n=1 Tax=Kipferlia bialata TaxID=797122 RepID=A0A9K3CNP3_9EUKA|nr:hypothetical protein KIPB_000209 [Kipferlia bialata]|eukprot:g209.t1